MYRKVSVLHVPSATSKPKEPSVSPLTPVPNGVTDIRLKSYSLTLSLVKSFYRYSQPFYLLDESIALNLLENVYKNGNKTGNIYLFLYYSLLGNVLQRVYGVESKHAIDSLNKAIVMSKKVDPENRMDVDSTKTVGKSTEEKNGSGFLEIAYAYLFLSNYYQIWGDFKNSVGFAQLAVNCFRHQKPQYFVHLINAKHFMFTFFIDDVIMGIVVNVKNGYDPTCVNSSIANYQLITADLHRSISFVYKTVMTGVKLNYGKINTTLVISLLEHIRLDLILDFVNDNVNIVTAVEKFLFLQKLEPYVKEIKCCATQIMIRFIMYSLKAQLLFLFEDVEEAKKWAELSYNLALDKKFLPMPYLVVYSLFFLTHFYVDIDVDRCYRLLEIARDNLDKVPALTFSFFASKEFVPKSDKFKKLFEAAGSKFSIYKRYMANISKERKNEGKFMDIRQIQQKFGLIFGIKKDKIEGVTDFTIGKPKEGKDNDENVMKD